MAEKLENLNEQNPDVVKIKELKIQQYTPRCQYFGRNSKMTFNFKNNFGIDTDNWEHTMEIKLEKWSSLESGLVMSTGAPRKAFGPIPNGMRNLQPNEVSTDECVIDFDDLGQEQKDFVTGIEEYVRLLSESSEPTIKCILLEGLAGTGKMNTLGRLRRIHNSNILYIARANSLCTYVKTKLNLQTCTLCLFIMKVLNMSSTSAIELINDTDYVLPNPMLEYQFRSFNPTSFGKFLKPTESLTDFSNKDSNIISPWVNIIFLDELSMFSPGTLAFFVALINTACTVLREKFIIIFCGDFMHIPPVLTASMDYSPLIELCERTFSFTTQHRIVEETYLETVNKLCWEPPINAHEFLEKLKNVIPRNAFSSEVDYVYPFEDIEEAYTKLVQSDDIYTWLNDVKPEFFSRILALRAFTYSNREMHYSNLGLAFSIVSQLERKISKADIRKYICFTPYTVNPDYMNIETPKNSTILPFLPLIRFFPYRLLMLEPTNLKLSKKGLVYLIDWTLEEGYVTVYCAEIQKFLNIPCGHFKKNSVNAKLYGIPLEMAFATTFHIVQGQTLTQDVIIALNDIDHRELFAILTRIRNPSQIKNIYVHICVSEEENA